MSLDDIIITYYPVLLGKPTHSHLESSNNRKFLKYNFDCFVLQGKGQMQTYWLLGKEGRTFSTPNTNITPDSLVPQFLQILDTDTNVFDE